MARLLASRDNTCIVAGISGITFAPNAGFGFALSSLDDSNGPPAGFSLALFGNAQGFPTSAVSLGPDSIAVSFNGVSFDFPHDPDITEPPRVVMTLDKAVMRRRRVAVTRPWLASYPATASARGAGD